MTKGINIGDKIVLAYIIFVAIIVISLVAFLFYIYFSLIPSILTSEINELPVNSNTYPFLLQALIIVAGVVLGLFSAIFVEISKQLRSLYEIKDQYLKSVIILGLLVLGIISTITIVSSISYSINGMLYYSIVNTNIATKINGGIIHTIGANGNVILINSTYFTANKNNISSYISQHYYGLVSSTKIAIVTMFLGLTIWIFLVIIYIIITFDPSDLLKSFASKLTSIFNKLTSIFKRREKMKISSGKPNPSNQSNKQDTIHPPPPSSPV